MPHLRRTYTRSAIVVLSAVLASSGFAHAQQPRLPQSPEVADLLKLLERQTVLGRAAVVKEFSGYISTHPNDPDNVLLEYEIARLYTFYANPVTKEEPDRDKAIELYEGMFGKYGPSDPVILTSRLSCSELMASKDTKRAKQLCQEVLDHVGDLRSVFDQEVFTLRAHYRLGLLATQEKDFDGAFKYFKKVLDFRRSDIPLKHVISYCSVRDNAAVGLIHLQTLMGDPIAKVAYLRRIAPLVCCYEGPAEEYDRVFQEVEEDSHREFEDEAKRAAETSMDRLNTGAGETSKKEDGRGVLPRTVDMHEVPVSGESGREPGSQPTTVPTGATRTSGLPITTMILVICVAVGAVVVGILIRRNWKVPMGQ